MFSLDVNRNEFGERNLKERGKYIKDFSQCRLIKLCIIDRTLRAH